MKFEPPPCGRSPDGQWIFSAKDLPILPIPKRAVVTEDSIEFDGWLFPLQYVTKSLLVWLHQTFIHWSKENDSEKNQEWIKVLVEAFQDAIAGNF